MYLLSCKWMFFRLVEPNKLYSCIKKKLNIDFDSHHKIRFLSDHSMLWKRGTMLLYMRNRLPIAQYLLLNSLRWCYWFVFFFFCLYSEERERIVDSLRIVRIYSPSPVEDSFKICAWGCCSLLLAWHFGCDNVASSFCLSLSLSLFHDRTHFCKAINFMICFNARCVALFLSLPVYRGKPKQLVVNANNWVPIFNR